MSIDLKKFNRGELLELLIAATKENEELKAENEDLRAQLENKMISISNAGSIAEASLALNGVFSAAQQAAEQYLMNMQQTNSICENMQKDAEAQAAHTTAVAESNAARVKAEAESNAARIKAEADTYAAQTVNQAKEQADAYWISVSQRLENFYKEHQALKEILNLGGGDSFQK